MPIKLDTIEALSKYLDILDVKIDHHASYAKTLIMPLLREVIRHADAGSLSEYGASINKGAVFMFRFNRKRFRLRSNTKAQQIELRNAQHQTIATFAVGEENMAEKFIAALEAA